MQRKAYYTLLEMANWLNYSKYNQWAHEVLSMSVFFSGMEHSYYYNTQEELFTNFGKNQLQDRLTNEIIPRALDSRLLIYLIRNSQSGESVAKNLLRKTLDYLSSYEFSDYLNSDSFKLTQFQKDPKHPFYNSLCNFMDSMNSYKGSVEGALESQVTEFLKRVPQLQKRYCVEVKDETTEKPVVASKAKSKRKK